MILFISDSISRFSSTIFFLCGQCATALVGSYLLMSLVSKCKYHYYQLLQITFSRYLYEYYDTSYTSLA